MPILMPKSGGEKIEVDQPNDCQLSGLDTKSNSNTLEVYTEPQNNTLKAAESTEQSEPVSAKALGCRFEWKLTIPRAAGWTYREVKVTVHALQPKSAIESKPGPNDKAFNIDALQNVDISQSINGQKSQTREITGPLLTARLAEQRKQKLSVFVFQAKDLPSTTKAAEVIKKFQIMVGLTNEIWQIMLDAIRRDLKLPPLSPTYFWCIPGPCPKPGGV